MKKLSFILVILGLFAFSQSIAQKEINEPGFFFNVGTFKPDINYYLPTSFDMTKKALKDSSDFRYTTGFNIEVGNYFVLKEFGDNTLFLRATWFDGNYSVTTEEVNDTTTNSYHFMQGSILKIGPNYNLALKKRMGIDFFYQIAPVFAGAVYEFGAFEDEMSSIGVLNTVGLSFRYRLFTAGLNYNFGTATDMDGDEYKDMGLEKADYTYKLGSFRFFLGMKF